MAKRRIKIDLPPSQTPVGDSICDLGECLLEGNEFAPDQMGEILKNIGQQIRKMERRLSDLELTVETQTMNNHSRFIEKRF